MSIPDTTNSSSSSSSSSSHHHHHHHHHSSSGKKRHMDDSDRFKRHGLSSIKRRRIMSQILFWLLVLAAIAVIIGVLYVYAYTPAKHYR